MSKVRVHEYAKKVNKTSKEVIEQLGKFDMPVKNHMAVLEADAVSKLDSVFKQATEPKKATPSKEPAKVQEKKQEARPQASNQQRTTNNTLQENKSTSPGEKIKNKGSQNRNMTQNNNNNRSGGTNSNNNNRNNNKGNFQQRRKPGINGGKRRTHRPAPQPMVQKELPAKITFYESLSVAELAKKLHREPSEIIKKLFMLGVMATINKS